MIEVNLVPDVKQELIRAERIRAVVISLAILVGAAAIGLVVLLGLWVFAVQTARGAFTDNTIKNESAKLLAVEDIESSLTIQNQLEKLPSLHEDKHVQSRIFDMLSAINPSAPNNVTISKLVVNSVDKTISIEAQAEGGYSALEVFKKTILATEFRFTTDEGEQVRQLASDMGDGERSYGETADGRRVLRFSLVFSYAEELLQPYLRDAKVVGPDSANVTESFLGIPKSLFSPKAADNREGSN